MTTRNTRAAWLAILVTLAPVLAVSADGPFRQQGTKLVGTGANPTTGSPSQGYSVGISGDGNTIIEGGFGDNDYSGSVWFFTRSNGVWSQQGSKLAGSLLDYFGFSVAISGDGKTALVGGPYSDFYGGGVWVYTQSGGQWTQQGGVLSGSGAISGFPSGSFQGYAVSLSTDGNTALIGGPNDNNGIGAAWVFTRSNGQWTQQGDKLVGTGAVGASEQGSAVALSGDGKTAIVAGPCDNGAGSTCQSNAGGVWIFTNSGGVWTQQGPKLVTGDAVGASLFGTSVALSSDGNTAIIGGPDANQFAGAAWIFTRSGGVWSEQAVLTAPDATAKAGQGDAVSLSGDGNMALVGGPGDYDVSASGASWVYTRSGSNWSLLGPALVGTGASGDAAQGYGAALSSDGSTAVVGGAEDGGGGGGAVWVFIATTLAAAPPVVGGVVSASSFGEFPAVAPGSWVEIYGTNLAGDTRSWTESDFDGINAPTALDGTSVTIAGQAAYVSFISSGQVNVQVPTDVSSGPQPLIVTTPVGSSNSYTTTVNSQEPGLLAPASFVVNGNQYLAALFPDYSAFAVPTGAIPNVASRPAQPGDTLILYGVGFGGVSPYFPAGELIGHLNTVTAPFDLFIGGVQASVAYDGLAPNYVGLYQFNVVVPHVAASGLVPVTFTLDGNPGAQTLYIAVETAK